MWECNVKMLRAVGVAGVSGQSALAADRVWHLRRWYARPKSQFITFPVSPVPCAPDNQVPVTSFTSWRTGNLSVKLTTNKPRPKVKCTIIYLFIYLFNKSFIYLFTQLRFHFLHLFISLLSSSIENQYIIKQMHTLTLNIWNDPDVISYL